MFRTLLLVFFVLIAPGSFSQFSIIGQVTDPVSKKGVSFITVSLVKATDSTLITFSGADSARHFKFTGIDKGRYLIAASYVGYLPLWFPVNVIGDLQAHDIGVVLMKEISNLEDITVTHA